MRWAAAVDDNQPMVVKQLRQAGFSVETIHRLGKGVPDLLVGDPFNRRNYLFELKDFKKPPSQRKLTADEVIWQAGWRGQVDTVYSAEEIIAIIWSKR